MHQEPGDHCCNVRCHRRGDTCTTLGDQRSSLHSARSPSMTRLLAIAVCLIGALLAEAYAGVPSCAALLQPRTAEGALKTEML